MLKLSSGKGINKLEDKTQVANIRWDRLKTHAMADGYKTDFLTVSIENGWF